MDALDRIRGMWSRKTEENMDIGSGEDFDKSRKSSTREEV